MCPSLSVIETRREHTKNKIKGSSVLLIAQQKILDFDVTYSFLIAFTTVCVNGEIDGAPVVEAIVEEYREMRRTGRIRDCISPNSNLEA